MVALCDVMGQPIALLYSPPSPSKYHPIERCWGMLALHWNGTQWVEGATMWEWAKRMPWQGIAPIVERSRQGDPKGGALSKRAMQAVEARRTRHAELPTWDILILPAATGLRRVFSGNHLRGGEA